MGIRYKKYLTKEVSTPSKPCFCTCTSQHVNMMLQDECWIFLTISTVSSDKTVLTTTLTNSTDMVTWFIVFTLSTAPFSAIQSKLSRWTLYEKRIHSLNYEWHKNQPIILNLYNLMGWIIKPFSNYIANSEVNLVYQSMFVYPGLHPLVQCPVCLLHGELSRQ